MVSDVRRLIAAAVSRAAVPTPRLLASVSSSLLVTMVLTSGLGALFWWVAARLFTTRAVGVAAGSISAMTFLGTIAMAGAGTLILRELPRNQGQERTFVSTAAAVTLAVGLLIGTGYALAAPAINPELAALASSPLAVGLFVAGVLLTIGTSLADFALLAMLHATVRLIRNVVFAGSKLILLVPAAAILGAASQRAVYGAWVAGLALSVALLVLIYRRGIRPAVDARLIPRYAGAALMHFALSMALAFPVLIIPVLVSLLGTPVDAAKFYVAWMLASVAYYPAVALAQSLFALAGRAPEAVWLYARATITLSFAAGVVAVGGAIFLGGPVLGLFGPAYRESAAILPILVAVAIPQTVKDHFQTLSRLRGDFGPAVALCGVGGVAETIAATTGFVVGGVAGLATAWLAVSVVEGLIMAPLMIRIARPAGAAAE